MATSRPNIWPWLIVRTEALLPLPHRAGMDSPIPAALGRLERLAGGFILAGMQAQLIPADGSPAIAITKDLTLVGRKEECDLCLSHKSVSKLHCVIVKTDA